MWNSCLSLFLCFMLVIMPISAKADESPPDPGPQGKVTSLSVGETAPYSGILFDLDAALKLKVDKKFSLLESKLKLEFEIKKLKAAHDLKVGDLELRLSSLKSRTDSILQIKNDEIGRLQELIKDDPNDNTHWWFAGGIVAGVLLSIGIFYAAAEASK